MSSPIERFDALASSSEFLFVVYYRGHWCPFCISYLRQLQSLTSTITAAGGKTLIVTAEAADQLESVRKATGYEGEAINDTENLLVKELKKRDLLDVAISSKGGYEHGMAQPAILVLKKDGTMVYQWAIVPSMMNLGGAKDRPELKQVWDNAEAQLQGKPVVHKKYALLSISGVLREKILG